jgi:nitrogen fixation protein FixH
VSVQARKPFELNGWHVLAMLLAFFASVIAVDVVMAVKAYATFPGEVSATPYEDGLHFNRTIAARAEERQLGWRAKVQATVADVGRVQVRITILDRAGAPVRGLTLSGRLERPATEAGRLEPRFTETRPGVYDAVAPDTPGAWDLTLIGTDPSGERFDARQRLVLR